MNEASIQLQFQKLIKAAGGKCYKLHGGPYSIVGQPDIMGILDGKMFAIEFKRPGGKATPKQEIELKEWERQGVIAFVSDNAKAAFERVSNATGQN